MAVLTTAEITISLMIDIVGTYRFYQLVTSGTTVTKPTGAEYPPPDLLYNTDWTDTEPTYMEGEDLTLYYVDCTVYSNGTCSYSEVSFSSSYTASKEANNKIDDMTVWNHTAFSIDAGETLVETVVDGSLESGGIYTESTDSALIGDDDDDISGYYRTGYIKVIPEQIYTWTATDNRDGTLTEDDDEEEQVDSILPTTFFYESEDGSTFTYKSHVNTSSVTVPSSDKDVYIRAAFLSASELKSINAKLTLYDLDNLLTNGATLYLGETTTLEKTPPYLASQYAWSLPDNEMQAYMVGLLNALDESLTGSLTNLSDKLYAAEGSIPALQEALGDLQDKLTNDFGGYIAIIPDEATIKLGKVADPTAAKVVVTNEKISFQKNEVEGASIGYTDSTGERTSMMADTTYITENFPRAKVDGEWVGQLCWIARTNGHLSLKVVK